MPRAEKPHILVLTSTFPRWENDPKPAFVFELSRRLKTYFDITVLCPRTPGAKDQENMAGLQVIRHPYFFRNLENLTNQDGGILHQLTSNSLNYLLVPFFLMGQIRAIIKLIRKEKIDAVHAHWIIPQGFAASIALMITRKSLPLICTSHGGDLYGLQGIIFEQIKRWIIKRSQHLTVVSHAMKDTVVDMGIPEHKVAVISMGVDLKEKFVPTSHNIRASKMLLFVGRLVEKKGLNILIDAMPRILARFPDVQLTVAGSGPLEANLRKQCRSLGLTDQVAFLGSQPQSKLPGLYQQAAMAVFPFIRAKDGDQEGLGLVVIEAMGCGCPVIASDLPAVRDTVKHGKTGWSVTPGDSIVLADRIITALENPDQLRNMADPARNRVVELFDWQIVAKNYTRCINAVLTENTDLFE
jgi:glycosyltransferase involved in cell wall biosynthesis